MFSPINQHSHAKSSEAVQSNLWTAHQNGPQRILFSAHHMGANPNWAIITQKHAELAHYYPWEHPLVNFLVIIFCIVDSEGVFCENHEDFQKRHLRAGTSRPAWTGMG